MNNFQYGNRSRGGQGPSRRGFGGRDSGRSSMHDAVCDDCGKDCQVPFRPSGDKPIYCSDCFEKKGGRDSNRSRGGRDSGRSFQSRASDPSTAKLVESMERVNTKLDTIIDLLSPTGKKKSKSVKGEAKKKKKAKKQAVGLA